MGQGITISFLFNSLVSYIWDAHTAGAGKLVYIFRQQVYLIAFFMTCFTICVLFPTKCLVFHYFILVHIIFMFHMKGVLKFHIQPQLLKV